MRNPMHTKKEEAIRTAYTSIVGNAAMALVKGLTGIFGHSYALIADAIESTTDVFASILLLVGLHYATRPADKNHPYGHGKLEPLITFIIVGFLLVSATVIASESIENIQTPHRTPEKYTLVVLAVIIVVKEIFYRIVAKKGEELNSSALKADAWHHRSDAITSLMAFIGISVAIYMGKGYETADDWAALLASGIIAYNAYLIFLPALSEVMDEHIYPDLVKEIRKQAMIVEGVKGTEKCYVRKAGMSFHVDLHLRVDGELTVTEGHTIAHEVKNALKEQIPEIADVLIHVEPAPTATT